MKKTTKFFAPHVTFIVQDCNVSTINKLKEFKMYRFKQMDDRVTFSIPLLHKKKAEQVLRNHNYAISTDKSIFDVLNFLHAHYFLIGCLVIALVGLFLLNGLIFRISVEGLEGGETKQVQSFLNEHGVRRLMRKSSIDGNVAVAVTENFSFISHSVIYFRGQTLVIRAYHTHTPDLPPKTDITSQFDAVVTEILVLSGTAAVRVGEVVTVGQVLVCAAYQTGVEVGEMDEYGRFTYIPLYHETHAMGIVKGRVGYAQSTIVAAQELVQGTAARLQRELLTQAGWTNIPADEIDVQVFAVEHGLGGISVEVVVSRVLQLN